MDNGTLTCLKVEALLTWEYTRPKPLKVSFRRLLPSCDCSKKFIEAWCELADKGALDVDREMGESNIAFLAPRLSNKGTCTWFDKSGNRSCGDNAGELYSSPSHHVSRPRLRHMEYQVDAYLSLIL